MIGSSFMKKLKALMFFADSWTTNFIKTALIFDKRYTTFEWRMLKNHWYTFKICLFSQSTGSRMSKFEP